MVQQESVGRARDHSVLAIVVNFNAGDLLGQCIEALLNQHPLLEVCVLDNRSSDGSETAAEAEHGASERFTLFRSKENLGFAAGVNKAVDLVLSKNANQPDYLLIINPDCIAEQGAVQSLTDALHADPGAAIAGPLVTDGEGRVQRATMRRFPTPWSALQAFAGKTGAVDLSDELPAETVAADAVSGACMLISLAHFELLGGMDEAYAMHCEDLDLMYRAHQQGFSCLFVPAARVVHLQGESSRSRPVWVHWQKHRGMYRFFNKFQRKDHAWPLGVLVLVGVWARFLVTLPFQWRFR